jgi:N-acetylmuramoyl-L-alanine amidase
MDENVNVIYDGHVQDIGNIGPFQNGELCGTFGKSKRLEALSIKTDSDQLGVEYEGQIQNIGWTDVKRDGELLGTVGQGLRLEAVKIRLTGEKASEYDIYYGVHAENYGDMNWAMNGEPAGTEGLGLRIEGIKILIVPKSVKLTVDDVRNFVKAEPKPAAPATPAVPAGNLTGKIICINPGHGGSDPGACGDLRESDMNLTVALRLGQLLAERGAQVIYTRTTDVHVYLSDRPVIANNAGADLFISIHHNGSSDPSSSGTCAICYPGSDAGIRLATLCLNGLYNRLGLQQRGLIQRDDSDVTYTDMPAVITEASFASSPADCAFFQNGGAELEALGILDGILAYFG